MLGTCHMICHAVYEISVEDLNSLSLEFFDQSAQEKKFLAVFGDLNFERYWKQKEPLEFAQDFWWHMFYELRDTWILFGPFY